MKHFTTKIGILGVTLMMVLFSCGNAGSKDKITLEYNLKQGETYKQNTVTDMKITQKIMDQEMTIDMKMSMKMSFEVKEIQDNRYKMELNYKELKVDAGIPGMGNMSFDSNTPEDIATQADFGPMFKAIIDKPIDFVMDKRGKVESITGFDRLKEAMINSIDENMPEALKQQIISQFGAQISEEALKAMFEQTSNNFPDKPVGVNDKWENKVTVNTSGFGLNLDLKFVLKSIEGNVVNLDIDGTLATPEGFEQEVNGMKVKVSATGTQKGSMKIDKNTGWLISMEILQDFGGESEVMGMKIPLSVSGKTTSTND
jgi:hypothetical protein